MKSQKFIQYIIGIGILIMLNLLASAYFFRVDLTQEKRYSLSDYSKETLDSLDRYLTVKVYLEGEFPPRIQRFKQAVRDMLTEMKVYGGNMIQFELQKEISRIMEIEDVSEQNKFSGLVMKRLADANFEMLADSIDSVLLPDQVVTEKEYIVDYLKNCDKKTHETIKNHIVKLKDSSKSKPLKVKCLNCSHDYEQAIALNVTDFSSY
jgi:hypothetical protein